MTPSPAPRDRRVRAAVCVWLAAVPALRPGTGPRGPPAAPASAGQRARRVHGEGPGAARGQPPDARPVRPRREASSSRSSVPAAWPLYRTEARVHVVCPRRHPRAQPGPLRRREGRRRGAQGLRGHVDPAASASGRSARTTRSKDGKDKDDAKQPDPKSPSPPMACESVGGDARFRRRGSSPKPTSWTSSSSPATTTSPAANSSKASRCCESSTTRRKMFNDDDEDKNEQARRKRQTEEKARPRATASGGNGQKRERRWSRRSSGR